MASVSLRVWSPPAAAPGQVALPLDEPGTACTARLRCLDGANALHLALLGPGGDVLARAEPKALLATPWRRGVFENSYYWKHPSPFIYKVAE